MKIDQIENSRVTIFDRGEVFINSIQDMLDLLGNLQYNNCDKILINEQDLSVKFFNLKSRFAGEVLQILVNYRVKIAIVGDFAKYNSNSLNSFIFECNQGNQVFFVETIDKGLDLLHGVK